MGFQLWPIGIGWREFSRTNDAGTFDCPNPRCKGKRDGSNVQGYRLRTARNWITVLFVPLIPVNRRGFYVECRACKSVMPVSVLDRPGVKSDSLPDGVRISFEEPKR